MTRHYLVLGAILAIAAVLRVVAAEAQGLWMDEGLTIAILNWPVFDLMFRPVDSSPGLYYVLHKALIAPDAPLLAQRSVSIMCGVAAVGVFYALSRLAFGKTAGLIAAALLAAHTAHVDYSQEARAYSLLVLTSLVCAFGTLWYAKTQTAGGRRAALALFAAGAVLSIHTHATAAPFIAGASVMVVITALRRRHPPRELAAVFALMALGALPVVLSVLAQSGEAWWLQQATGRVFLREMGRVLLPWGLWENPVVGWRREQVWGVIASGAVLGVAVGLGLYGRRVLWTAAGGLILVYALFPFALWGQGLFAQPTFMLRTALLCVPGFLLLMAGLIAASRWPALLGTAAASIYLASSLLFGLQQDQQDMRGAARVIAREARPGDVILVCPEASVPALSFHATTRPAGRVMFAQGYDGKFLGFDAPLGEARWDRRYFETAIRPVRGKARPQLPSRAFGLEPGSAVFLVDVGCTGPNLGEAVMRRLAEAGASTDGRWRLVQRQGAWGDVVVTRYRVGRSVTWTALVAD